jgi:hypothetical protein
MPSWQDVSVNSRGANTMDFILDCERTGDCALASGENVLDVQGYLYCQDQTLSEVIELQSIHIG